MGRNQKIYQQMKRYVYYFLYILIVLISACKMAAKKDFATNNQYDEKEYKSLFDPARYMIPTPEGVYTPPGLKKMDFLSQLHFGMHGGNINALEFRDEHGNKTSFDSLNKSDKHLITQLFVNDSGRVVEAVSFEMTQELATAIRDGYIPTNSDTSTGERKLVDRFMIPTAPGAYAPQGLRKLSIIEMLKYGEAGKVNGSYVKKNDKGEVVGEDYYTSGPNPRYLQIFVGENGEVVEAVVYEMTEEISALFTLMRFTK